MKTDFPKGDDYQQVIKDQNWFFLESMLMHPLRVGESRQLVIEYTQDGHQFHDGTLFIHESELLHSAIMILMHLDPDMLEPSIRKAHEGRIKVMEDIAKEYNERLKKK